MDLRFDEKTEQPRVFAPQRFSGARAIAGRRPPCNPNRKAALESLQANDGIRTVSASTITGNVLVSYDPSTGLPDRVSYFEAPWRETNWKQYELTLVFVLAAVGLVLLIACADVSSLLLSRALQRQKEIAIRASLGAGGWRVLRQLLAESLVLSAIGSAAGILVARWALQYVLKRITALPIALPHSQRARSTAGCSCSTGRFVSSSAASSASRLFSWPPAPTCNRCCVAVTVAARRRGPRASSRS